MEQQRLKNVLVQLGYTDDEVRLEEAGGGKVGGVLVSGRFAGRSQEERQQELWAALRKNMKPEDLLDIVALMTMTPEEIAA
jgi:acid stress-induced BolA-like protein IbaG/YrbA